MWMSFITSGVKMRELPSKYLLLSAGVAVRAAIPVEVRVTGEPFCLRTTGCFTRIVETLFLRASTTRAGLLGGVLAMSSPFEWHALKHELLFARLEIVVVPQLLAGDDLAEAAEALGLKHFIHAQFARQPLAIELCHLRPD